MSNPAEVGGRKYRGTLKRGRTAITIVRGLLKKAFAKSRSADVKGVLGEASLELGDVDDALYELEEIGRKLRE